MEKVEGTELQAWPEVQAKIEVRINAATGMPADTASGRCAAYVRSGGIASICEVSRSGMRQPEIFCTYCQPSSAIGRAASPAALACALEAMPST